MKGEKEMTDPWSRAMRALREIEPMSEEEREEIRKKEEERLKELAEQDKALMKRIAEEERRKTPEQKKKQMEEWLDYWGSKPVEFWLIVSNADPTLYWNPTINTGCFAKRGVYYRSREVAQAIIDAEGLDAHPELDYKRD
jgi:hypothetical protein